MKTIWILAVLLAPWALLAGAPPAQADDAADAALVQLRRDLHKHPELANRETQTMERIAAELAKIGLTDVKKGVARTGVAATLQGGKAGPVVAVRVSIDAFPIQEKKRTDWSSEVAGVSHACGHDAMTAMAVGAARELWAARADLAGSVRFLFQPAEEGAPEGEPGGAALMISEGALKDVTAILAFHVDADIPAGQAGLHPGAVYAGADTFEVKVDGKGAHGATPWRGVDAVAVAAQIVSGLQLVVSRQSDIFQPIVLTVGTAQGGVRSNATAGEAKLAGTLRTYAPASRERARASMALVVEHIAAAFGAKGTLRFTEEIPPTVNDAALAVQLRPALEAAVGKGNLGTLLPLPYADDFAFMSSQVPSLYFQLGVRNEKEGIVAGTHTEDFDVDEKTIPLGAKLVAALARQLLEPQKLPGY